eukprot:399159-Prymnesium_polylepis.1
MSRNSVEMDEHGTQVHRRAGVNVSEAHCKRRRGRSSLVGNCTSCCIAAAARLQQQAVEAAVAPAPAPPMRPFVCPCCRSCSDQ